MNHRRITIAVVSGLLLEIINKISPLLILHHAQKALGLTDFGWAQYQLAVFEAVQPLIVFGFPNYALAESGAKGDLASKSVFTHVFVLKAINGLLVIIGFVGMTSWRDGVSLDRFAAGVLTLLVVSAVTDTYWFTILRHKLAAMSLVSSLVRVIFLGLILICVASPDDRGLFVVLSILPNALVAVGTGFYAYRQLGFIKIDGQRLRQILRGALPFALIVLLTTLLDRADLFLVESWFGLSAAGVYAGPAKVAQSLSFLISALALPFYAETLKLQDQKSLGKHAALSIWLLSALLAPVMFGTPFIDRQIIQLIFPGSAQSAEYLLSWLCLSMFGNLFVAVYGLQILMSKSRPWPVVGGALMALVTLVGVGYLTKAAFGLQALALAMVLAKLVFGGFCAVRARSELARLPWRPLFMPMLAGMAMGGGLALLRLDSLWAQTACGGVLYMASLITLNYREVRQILQHPKFSRWRRLFS